MSRLTLTLLGVLLATTVLAEGERFESLAERRKSELFNFDWKFKLGETVGAEKADFDDSQWRCLDLPHDFQIEMPWNDKANRSRGFKDMATGWYRKTFTADPAWRGHRVVLDFEGIMLHGDAWLNGQRIGGTDYGYLGFEADVTKLLKYDGKNVLAVHCSTGDAKNSRWYTGGGLFRDIHLILKDSVSIARHGIYIHTPQVSQQEATVSVQVEVEGIKNKKYDLVIEARIFGAVGAAAYETAISRMMDWLKAFGFNHIRTSHNPYSEAFLRLADEKGLLIVDELYDKWSNTLAWAGRRPWTEMWWENLMEWVKRDRNHPSVILWSLGNELQFQEERCGFPTRDWGITTYDIMNTLVKRLDPTRKTTVAMYPARAGGIVKHSPEYRLEENIVPPELAQHTEVASFNYCWEDYDKYMQQAPHIILYQSEATTNELSAPFFGMDRDHTVGLAYWGAIEYWGESNIWPKKGWDYSFFRHSLEPNSQAYLIKTIFKPEEPQVHIGIAGKVDTLWWNDIVVGQTRVSSHWNQIGDYKSPQAKYTVYTYTNGDEVELFVNGKSQGVKKNDDKKKPNVITWKGIAYEPGTIRAVARKGGQPYAEHRLETAGQPVRLVIETENADWRADGMDLQYVKVRAVDKKGRVVPTNDYKVTFQVEGPARIIAVDNGDHSSDDLFAGNEKQLYEGFAMAIVRSDRHQAGKVKLTVSSDGLKGASKTVVTK